MRTGNEWVCCVPLCESAEVLIRECTTILDSRSYRYCDVYNMSLDPLTADHVNGLVPRTCRHELESFCLGSNLCYSLCHQWRNVLPFRKWVALTSVDLGLQKTALPFVCSRQYHQLGQRPLLLTVAIWSNL